MHPNPHKPAGGGDFRRDGGTGGAAAAAAVVAVADAAAADAGAVLIAPPNYCSPSPPRTSATFAGQLDRHRTGRAGPPPPYCRCPSR